MPKWTHESNCYGYAVNVPKWITLNMNFDLAVETILMANPQFRLVNREDVKLGFEYVAFRFCKNDFHFIKRNKQGYWRHKTGSKPVEAVSTKKVFNSSWFFCGTFNYNSKLYLFEIHE